MPSFEQGDVVKVPFPYTDRSTRQRRPALVISKHGAGPDADLIWVVMITSADNRSWDDDVTLGARYGDAGLPAPSVVRPAKIATIDAALAEPIGRLESETMADVLEAVRRRL